MAVAFDASSESHTGTTGSTTAADITWTHTPVGTPKGVLVYTFTNANSNDAVKVEYGGYEVPAVTSGRAVDTAGEAGDCKAWFLSTRTLKDPTTTWAGAADLTSRSIRAVAYGNGYWVAVTEEPEIYCATSPNGPWSASSSSGAISSLTGVAFGNGYWVAVGFDGYIRYATDPTGTWSAPSSPGFAGNLAIYSVAYGNGYWVAVNGGNNLRYAADPTGTWTAASSPGFTSAIYSVAYGNGYWVGVGAAGDIRYAADPTGTWTAASSPGFSSNSVYSVAYGNGYWVAVDDAGDIRYATDPTGTWTAASSAGFSASAIYSVAYGNGYWVAGGDSGKIRYATDPTGTWTAASSPGFSSNSVYSVATSMGDWVAGGGSGLRYASNTLVSTVPSGANTVRIYRQNTSEMYAVAVTVTGDYATEAAGTTLAEGDGTLSEQSISDGSRGTPSMRFAGVNSGLSAVDLSTTTTAANTLVAGTNSTGLQSIGFADNTERNYLTSTTAISTTSSGTTIASGSTQSSTFVVAQTMVRSSLSAGAFRSDNKNWIIAYTLGSTVTPYEMRLKLQRRNSSGTMQTESSYGTTRSADGTYTDTISWTPGTWSANDQLALVWEHRRPSGTGNKSASITAGGTSYIDAPSGATSRVIGVVRETTAGQGSRSVGFQSTTSDDVAAVYLAIREAIVPWTAGFIPTR